MSLDLSAPMSIRKRFDVLLGVANNPGARFVPTDVDGRNLPCCSEALQITDAHLQNFGYLSFGQEVIGVYAQQAKYLAILRFKLFEVRDNAIWW